MFFTAAEQPNRCSWFGPSKALAVGACPESGLTVAQVEWHADELEAALAREFPAVGSTSYPNDLPSSKPGPGRPPQDNWASVLVETGLWLARNSDPGTVEAVADFMGQRFAIHGLEEPSRETRRKMAKIARAAIRAWRTGNPIS
jgi:hypothetical protein